MANTEDLSPLAAAPKVSVAITTYNIAKWLPRTLDSVLEQRTDFPFEIVISDDCSKDASVEIAHSYRERHPDLIRVIARPKNVGIQRNYYGLFGECRGKFIAWLDGDDYWTDPQKLAIQAATLESDPSINLCLHFVRVVTPDGQVRDQKVPGVPAGEYGLADLLRQNIVPSCSAMFRRELYTQLPDWYFDMAPLSDWPLWLLAARSGKVVLIDRTMADYMRTPGGAFGAQDALYCFNRETKFYEHVESILPPQHHRLARQEKRKRYEAMAYLLRKQGDLPGARRAAFNAFRSPSIFDSFYGKTKTLGMALLRETLWRLRGGTTPA
jgi:glycosyltransferase involved in cell wall biosynthesis